MSLFWYGVRGWILVWDFGAWCKLSHWVFGIWMFWASGSAPHMDRSTSGTRRCEAHQGFRFHKDGSLLLEVGKVPCRDACLAGFQHLRH